MAQDPKAKRLWQLYSLTLEDDKNLRAFQGNSCAICRRVLAADKGTTDHQHFGGDAGLIRGKLCWTCNKGLGFLGENIERLAAAIAYLQDPPAVRAIGKRFGRIGRVSNKGTVVLGATGQLVYRCGCTGNTKRCAVHRQPVVETEQRAAE